MKKLEDIVLQKGDIVEFEDGTDWTVFGIGGYTAEKVYRELDKSIKSIKRPVKFETIYEAPHEILDKEEKEWLEHFLRPFRNKVQYIVKHKADDITNGEFIYVKLADDCVWLPYFEVNTMYKGMKADKQYTLEELALFK